MSISFAGLASGFDSTAYIKAVMAQESVPLTNLQTKISNTTTFRSVFTTLNSKLAALKTATADLNYNSTFTVAKATSSDSSKLTVSSTGSASYGEYAVNVVGLAKAQVTTSKAMVSADSFSQTGTLSVPTSSGSADIDLSSTDFQGITNEKALDLIAQKINSTTGVTVKAAIVQTKPGEKTLVLTGKETGVSFSVSGTNTTFMNSTNVTEASNAKITVNGLAIESTSNTVKDAIPGVTLTLTGTGDSTVKVDQDTDQITSKIDTFVSAYNAVIDLIDANTQKSTKNSDGTYTATLQSDSTLRDLRNQLGNWVNTKFDVGNIKLLSDVGLEVDKGVTTASLMTGKLSFDKTKFAEAMAKDSDAVQKLFVGTSADNVGIGQFFMDKLQSYTSSVDGLLIAKIKGYDSDIAYMQEQSDSMQLRLDKREETLKAKYANLEVVMSSLNNQKTWITNQVATLTKSASSN
ncbi:flagellar filament capping protein FliD [Gorillibacterium massiliense]|uniref:flagellar filament capping protein FliD n=1 Tax=Gorillibacterium massiliense TaxID=1280390 RepID=UPI0004BA9743|nr:flagellar filament capping protein FliD [Gorillibacterium massiliense]